MEKKCNLCPRNCNVQRDLFSGFCGQTNEIKIAKVMLHYFEEPIISGEYDEETAKSLSLNLKNNHIKKGSGAIFFCGCNLRCVYCQNYGISHHKNDGKNLNEKNHINFNAGKSITTKELAKIFKKLEDAGANNINLVTPTHYLNQIIDALDIYHPNIPVVWNTSGYEKPETLDKLKGYVDIFLTDFKYIDSELAKKYSAAADYPKVCAAATLKCRELQPKDIIVDGIMEKGVIVRHLMLPNNLENTLGVIDWVYKNLGNNTIFSLMSQYVPFGEAENIKELNRTLKPLEYKIALKKLEKLDFKNAYIQDFESATKNWTPDFFAKDDIFLV